MKIYLASRSSRYLEMLEHAVELVEIGHEVTSRWITGPVEKTGSTVESRIERAQLAAEDIADLEAAELLIVFTDHPRSNARGGYHVEFGYALAMGMLICLVGPPGNVFHDLPDVMQFTDFDECLKVLAGLPPALRSGSHNTPRTYGAEPFSAEVIR